jgi:hypothetical protein
MLELILAIAAWPRERSLLPRPTMHGVCVGSICVFRHADVSPLVNELHFTTLAPLHSSLLQIQATAAWEKMQVMLIMHTSHTASAPQAKLAHSCALRDFFLNLECRLCMPGVSFCHQRLCFPDTRCRHLGRRNEGNLRGAGQSERHECKGYPCM